MAHVFEDEHAMSLLAGKSVPVRRADLELTDRLAVFPERNLLKRKTKLESRVLWAAIRQQMQCLGWGHFSKSHDYVGRR